VAVKIRLKRIGKKFSPVYRVVVLDARKKRDGRVIEEIGLYDPMQEPSLIRIDSQRVRYWLGVGAQPSETVHRLLKITGDYQAFKGLPVPEGKLRLKDEGAAARARLDAIRLADDDAQKRNDSYSAQAQAEQAQAEQAQEAGSEVVEGV
jgi:ribosomal protein S16